MYTNTGSAWQMSPGGPVGNFNGTYINNAANIYAPQTVQFNYPQPPAPQPAPLPTPYPQYQFNQFNQLNQFFAPVQPHPMPVPMPFPVPVQQPPQQGGVNPMLMMMLCGLMKKVDCLGQQMQHLHQHLSQRQCAPRVHQVAQALNPNVAFNQGAGLTGKVWGDPHFVNMQTGKTYDIHPAAGQTVYVFGDQNVQINGRTGAWGNGKETVFKEMGVKLGNHRLKVNADGAPTLDGQALTKGQQITLDNGSTVVWDGKDVSFETTTKDAATGQMIKEYSGKIVTSSGSHGKYLDAHMTVGKDGFGRDGLKPEGLLGRSAWATIDKVDPYTAKGAIAEGTTLADYTLQGNGDAALFADVQNGNIARFGRAAA